MMGKYIREIKHDRWKDLPTPRIQLETIPKKNEDWIIELSLIKDHFMGPQVQIILGITKVGGANLIEDEFYMPFRDGAHMKFDMFHLNLPCYLVNGKKYQEYILTARDVPNGMLEAWKKRKTNEQSGKKSKPKRQNKTDEGTLRG